AATARHGDGRTSRPGGSRAGAPGASSPLPAERARSPTASAPLRRGGVGGHLAGHPAGRAAVSRPEFDPERLLVALSGEIAVLRGRVDEAARAVKLLAEQQNQDDGAALAARLDELADQVRKVTELQQAADGGDDPAVWEWSSMTADQA